MDSAEWLRTQDDIASSEVGSLDARKIRTAEYGVKRYHPITYVRESEHLISVIDNEIEKCLETLSHLITHLTAIDQFQAEYIETKDGENQAPF